MQRELLTLGYQQRSLDEYINLLLEEGVGVLIDVRETAWSHKRGFSKTAFSAALAEVGIVYVHAPYVGNPKSLRKAAATHADCLSAYERYLEERGEILERFSAVVAEHITAGVRVCITCFERHAGDCHRSILADAWRERARGRVRHLATDGCRRLVTA